MKGNVPIVSSFRQTVAVTWISGQAWMVGDLHERNIMRDSDGSPTIIDALTGVIPPLILKDFPHLSVACDDARAFREKGKLPIHKKFDDVDDADL